MNLNWKLVTTSALALLFLAACNTATPENEKDVASQTTPQTEEEEKNNQNENDYDNEKDKIENNEAQEGSTTTETTNEKDGMTSKNNESPSVKATEKVTLPNSTLTKSDEQNFKLQLLPNYTLTSEEPGRDILFPNENDQIFMRIETQSYTKEQYDYYVDNSKEVLKASVDTNEIEPFSDTTLLPQGDNIKDTQAFTASNAENQVTTIVFVRDALLVRLTIYTTNEQLHLKEFIKMASTIQST